MTTLRQTSLGRRIALGILGVAFIVIASTLIAYNALLPTENVQLAAGDVAPADVIAPRSITYESDVLTRLARQAASDAIGDVYDPPNPSISRQQIQLARHVLDFVDNVRHDSYATKAQQVADLTAITALHVDAQLAADLLGLPDDAWKTVDGQVMNILERTMHDEIRENSLDNIYANLPNFVSATVDEAHTSIITALARDLIKPNTFRNDQRTHDAKTQTAAAIAPERRTFAQGQIVIRAGSIVTDADVEALTQLKLLQPADHRVQAFVAALLGVMVVSTLGTIYLRRLHQAVFHNVPQMVLIGALLLLFLAGSRIFGSGSELQSHLYPAAAFALIVVAVSGSQAAIMLTCALAALIGLMTNGSLEFAMLVAAGGTAGILSLNRMERLNTYFRAGFMIGVTNIAIGLLFALFAGTVDPWRVGTILVTGTLNGILSAGVAIVGLNLISSVLNLPTSIRLLDLSQPNHPLLQRLLREAPGTYQHSLQVANLGELAAERIRANAALVRVVALYHDVGKITYPHFFIENQADGANPHDALNDPERSARIIVGHVTEGEKLARKHRLPSVFIDAILQHHGTMKALYFYNKALAAVDCDPTRVDETKYQYPGPLPQSREMAILMLADSCESIVRAKRPHSKQEIAAIVGDIFDSRMAEGQLNSSLLTINDLRILRETFITTLQGVFHPRIAYPDAPTLPAPVPTAAAIPASTTNTSSVPPLSLPTVQDSKP